PLLSPSLLSARRTSQSLACFSIMRRPPSPTPFPYTTLFRSHGSAEPAPGGGILLPHPWRRGHRRDRGQDQEHRLPLRNAERCHQDRKSTRLNSSHVKISYAVFCLKKKKGKKRKTQI